MIDSVGEVECSVCGRPVGAIDRAPFTVQSGDCISVEGDRNLRNGTEHVTTIFRIRHSGAETEDHDD